MSGEGGKYTWNKYFFSQSYTYLEIIKQPFRAIFFANSSWVSKEICASCGKCLILGNAFTGQDIVFLEVFKCLRILILMQSVVFVSLRMNLGTYEDVHELGSVGGLLGFVRCSALLFGNIRKWVVFCMTQILKKSIACK